jgi:AbrB family looped-hinge helix DNA binding protein
LEPAVRVTSKGQVTIPKPLRQRTGIKSGAEVDFSVRDGDLVIRKAPPRRRPRQNDMAAWIGRARGTVDLGMTTDAFMELLRGE